LLYLAAVFFIRALPDDWLVESLMYPKVFFEDRYSVQPYFSIRNWSDTHLIVLVVVGV